MTALKHTPVTPKHKSRFSNFKPYMQNILQQKPHHQCDKVLHPPTYILAHCLNNGIAPLSQRAIPYCNTVLNMRGMTCKHTEGEHHTQLWFHPAGSDASHSRRLCLGSVCLCYYLWLAAVPPARFTLQTNRCMNTWQSISGYNCRRPRAAEVNM